MIGRSTEIALLREMIDASRAGNGNAIAVHGDAGIGKSTLLATVADTVPDEVQVLRATGVEAEAELPFAALHLLLRPVRRHIDGLPSGQRAALSAAFGEAGEQPPDRFLVGLAALTLLAELSERSPLLCLVDDVQWLDRASADALLFAARRLTAERITMIFAGRDGTDRVAHDLPELRLSTLSTADSARLVAEQAAALDPGARDRVVAESEGNPLALLTFARALTPEQRAGHLAPVPLRLTDTSLMGRLERSLRTTIRGLPERTRTLLLTAAAEGAGGLDAIVAAAKTLGAGPEDLTPAEQAELLTVSGAHVHFRHPLIRAAAYDIAPLADRAAAHRALAGALDGADHADRRAWHLSAAALGPDEETSAILAAAGERARRRGGNASAATAFERAAQLTVDREHRARLLATAADAMLAAGQLRRAASASERGTRLTAEPVLLARLASVRAAVDAEQGDPAAAARTLIAAAGDIAGTAPVDALTMLAAAAGEAWFAGDHAALVATAAILDRLGPRLDAGLIPVATAMRGMERMAAGDPAVGVSLLRGAIPEDRSVAAERVPGTYAMFSALMAGDDDAARELATARVEACRSRGLIGELPHALQLLTQAQILSGRHAEAADSGAEAWRIAHDTGQAGRLRHLHGILARLAAVRGEDEECRDLARQADGGALERHGSGWGGCALGLLDLVRSRYEEVAERMTGLLDGPLGHTVIVTFAVPDHVEACVRLGTPARALPAFARFDAWAEAAGRPWALAVAHRCRALLGPNGEAEAHYREALAAHDGGGRPFEQARTRLAYGEWLRRARRRADAREQLTVAAAGFDALGAVPWAERARAELTASGAHVTTRAAPAATPGLDTLTPQELQVVRLAASGATNRQIGARLFLSPRTVGFHLYKAYPKLGVASRGELAGLDLG
ncbi:helix-turn-helix transcriptional regulator [Phytomonospora endophytica]|uniref:DNA-binding CsgD family transcriptional regulator n=1 Tax=Phytomonospora endophytica TaxID=714109 RepID=A0A841FR73_9ACTN|nr:LuxR family transcriptional regulator [Phytomonospora endophytica]MBB6038705.1 DNA-binding CsgD family transcriptional regulator [Phytomonospora endophytica]GIG68498.1 transcriptional regulator [Phytomonospora endophytica]